MDSGIETQCRRRSLQRRQRAHRDRYHMLADVQWRSTFHERRDATFRRKTLFHEEGCHTTVAAALHQLLQYDHFAESENDRAQTFDFRDSHRSSPTRYQGLHKHQHVL